MIYTKTPDKRKKTSTSSDPHSDLIYHHHDNLLHSDPLKVADHVTEGLQIIRNVMEGDYAAISKRLATGGFFNLSNFQIFPNFRGIVVMYKRLF